MLLILVLAGLRPARAQAAPGFAALLARERTRHPAGTVADLYKFVYQASMGPAHFGLDSAMARTWLDREWEEAGPPGPGEPLLDTIAPGGTLVRLNLRPYRALGGTKAALVRTFVASARDIRPDTALLVRRWREVERKARSYRFPWSASAMTALLVQQRRNGFPAPDHSAGYLKRYRPAYRVLTGARADSLVASLRR